jgi:hypothetical protein
MMPIVDKGTSRRCFIKFLAGSPLVVGTSFSSFAQGGAFSELRPDPYVWAPRDYEHLISTPQEALDVFDFETACALRIHGFRC